MFLVMFDEINTHQDTHWQWKQEGATTGKYLVRIHEMFLYDIQASFHPQSNFDQVIQNKLNMNIP